jgi:surface antigen
MMGRAPILSGAHGEEDAMNRSVTRLVLGLLLAGVAGTLPSAAVSDEYALLMDSTLQESLENTRTHDVSIWESPDGNSFGTITPVLTYRNDAGENCREYQKTVVIAGREQRAYGTACRRPDGAWQIVSGETAARVVPEPLPPAEPVVIYRDRVVVQPVYYVPVGYPAWSPLWAAGRRTLAIGYSDDHYRYYYSSGGRRYYRWGGHFSHANRGGRGHGKHFRRANLRRGH